MKKTTFRMKYQGKQSAFPFKSPIKNEKLIGPVKPMVDKDGDGIPDFVDSDRGDGSKNTNKDISTTEKKKKNTKKKKVKKPEEGKEVQGIIQIDPTIKPPMGLDR
jgi:hypothetical protein